MREGYVPRPELVEFAEWLKKQPKGEQAKILRRWMSGLPMEDLCSDRAEGLLKRIDKLEE